MVRTISLFLILASILTLTSSAYSQTEKNTMTLSSGEVVCDLNGEWNALYKHYGLMQWVGDMNGTVMIAQQGKVFVGTSLTAGSFTLAGTEKIRGELDRDSIKKARYFRPDKGWVDAKGEISKDCNKLVIDDGDGVKALLERK